MSLNSCTVSPEPLLLNDAIMCISEDRNNKLLNLAWRMESGVWNSIPSLGFTSKNGIKKHVKYSIPSLPKFGIQGKLVYIYSWVSSLVFNHNVGFDSQVWYLQRFPR